MTAKSPLIGVSTSRRADPPQRYSGNYARYIARGGQLRLEDDLKGFLAHGLNHGDMSRFYFFCLVFDQLVKEGLSGDVAELGVYKGNTAALLAGFARRLGSTAYFLDTYEGFSDQDLTGIDANAKPGSFNDTSLEAVRALVGEDNVKFVKGFFPDTAAALPADGAYCLVHIDCDLYAPMNSALAYFYPRLVPGGFLIVHDYSSLHWNGAEKAVDEFFADKPECVLPLPDGAGSVAIRKARPAGGSGNWLDRKRRAVIGADWSVAANGKLADLLGIGWSGPEAWGVWGVGDNHVLHLIPPPGEARELHVEFDVQAALSGARSEQVVDVSIAGRMLTSWTFTLARNRDVRRLRIPLDAAMHGQSASAQIDIAFAPRSVMRASDMKPDSVDTRALGLGLHRVRLVEAA